MAKRVLSAASPTGRASPAQPRPRAKTAWRQTAPASYNVSTGLPLSELSGDSLLEVTLLGSVQLGRHGRHELVGR